MKKLHLGCGNDYRTGYVNCDVTNKVKVDMIVDLEKKLPFPDNSVDEVITNHTLEHVNNLVQLMEELHRVTINGAVLKIKVPYFATAGAFQDPTHVRFFALRTFDYFSEDSNLNYYSTARFKTIKRKVNFIVSRPRLSNVIGLFVNNFPRLYEKFMSRIIPCEELEIVLETIKPTSS